MSGFLFLSQAAVEHGAPAGAGQDPVLRKAGRAKQLSGLELASAAVAKGRVWAGLLNGMAGEAGAQLATLARLLWSKKWEKRPDVGAAGNLFSLRQLGTRSCCCRFTARDGPVVRVA